MSYFVTIYIHPIREGIPHTFLGLTRKHPDELDKLVFEKNIEYWNDILGKIVIFEKEEIKWYEKFESIEFSDGFYGFASVNGTTNYWGKVFQYNHFVPKWNNDKQIYEYAQRTKSSFSKNHRCVFEISKEQYEMLLKSIKQDVQKTKDRNGNLQKDDSKLTKSIDILKENLYYNSNPVNSTPYYNCTTWALHKLDSIGLEVIDINEWIPDADIPNVSRNMNTLLNKFNAMRSIHSAFLKFQAIDENLKSIKGAKAFRMWARSMIENSYICHIDYKILEQTIQAHCTESMDDKYYNSIKHFYTIKLQLQSIYGKLNDMLEKIISKANDTNLKGDFEFIYWDKQDKQVKTLKSSNDYEPTILKEIDLSNPAYNFSVCKFAPFIFIPNDKTLSQRLYHKYDYGNVTSEYQDARNEFYQSVLAGIQSDKYWSSNYHKLTKNLSKNEISKVANA
ncbi:hypothetical protein [Helicobacter sp. T3_23-1056]